MKVDIGLVIEKYASTYTVVSENSSERDEDGYPTVSMASSTASMVSTAEGVRRRTIQAVVEIQMLTETTLANLAKIYTRDELSVGDILSVWSGKYKVTARVGEHEYTAVQTTAVGAQPV